MHSDLQMAVAALVIDDRIREAAAARASRDLPRARRPRNVLGLVRRAARAGRPVAPVIPSRH